MSRNGRRIKPADPALIGHTKQLFEQFIDDYSLVEESTARLIEVRAGIQVRGMHADEEELLQGLRRPDVVRRKMIELASERLEFKSTYGMDSRRNAASTVMARHVLPQRISNEIKQDFINRNEGKLNDCLKKIDSCLDECSGVKLKEKKLSWRKFGDLLLKPQPPLLPAQKVSRLQRILTEKVAGHMFLAMEAAKIARRFCGSVFSDNVDSYVNIITTCFLMAHRNKAIAYLFKQLKSKKTYVVSGNFHKARALVNRLVSQRGGEKIEDGAIHAEIVGSAYIVKEARKKDDIAVIATGAAPCADCVTSIDTLTGLPLKANRKGVKRKAEKKLSFICTGRGSDGQDTALHFPYVSCYGDDQDGDLVVAERVQKRLGGKAQVVEAISASQKQKKSGLQRKISTEENYPQTLKFLQHIVDLLMVQHAEACVMLSVCFAMSAPDVIIAGNTMGARNRMVKVVLSSYRQILANISTMQSQLYAVMRKKVPGFRAHWGEAADLSAQLQEDRFNSHAPAKAARPQVSVLGQPRGRSVKKGGGASAKMGR